MRSRNGYCKYILVCSRGFPFFAVYVHKGPETFVFVKKFIETASQGLK